MCRAARGLVAEGRHKEAAEICMYVSTLCIKSPNATCHKESELCRASAEARLRGDLKKAEDLLDQDIHPTVITKGFRMAKSKALEVLNDIAVDVTIKDEGMLLSIAETAMSGKSAEKASKELAEIAVDAVKKVDETLDDIKREHLKIFLDKNKKLSRANPVKN